jgi:hypothetical protein
MFNIIGDFFENHILTLSKLTYRKFLLNFNFEPLFLFDKIFIKAAIYHR